MEFQNKDKLDSFLNEINDHLMNENNRWSVTFPPENVPNWDGENLTTKNEELLVKISREANVYMLFTAEKGSTVYKLRYIGKTKREYAKERLKNHLFKKHKDTGAKLEEVKSHVKSGGSIKLSWVTIEPESLRNWAEEELISKHREADWNSTKR